MRTVCGFRSALHGTVTNRWRPDLVWRDPQWTERVGGKQLADHQTLRDVFRIISRSAWGARAPSTYISNMPRTPRYIFIHHGTGSSCTTRSTCSAIVRSYQDYHRNTKGWGDIGYNFLVGEDGNVYEGRGWRKLGAHTRGYNDKGIAICFIGDFTNRTPNSRALQAAQQLIRCAVNTGKVTSSYTLKGHRDVGQTACPGNALYNLIKRWPHFVAGTRLYSG